MSNPDKLVDTARIVASFVAGQSRVLFVPNPGNAGDAAIACSTLQLLDRTGVAYTPGTLKDISPGLCVIVSGGGNLVPYYNDVRRILLTCLQRNVNKCLLLPHSVRGHEDVLAQLDERFVLLCRDHGSLAFVREHAPRAQCALARDLVLELDISALERKTQTLAHRLALLRDRQWTRSYLRWRLALRRIRPDATGTLTTLRSDIESQSPDRKKRRQDLMRYQGLGHVSPAIDQITMDLINHFRKAQRVVTDRLHASLLANLAGKPTCLVENSYRKLADVWEAAFYTPGEDSENKLTDLHSMSAYETLVITLQSDHARQSAMRQQLTDMGMRFRFFDAVNGRMLPELPLEYDRKKRLRHFGFDMAPGEIGCFLSHRNIWQYAAQANKTVLVLEDDARLSPDLGQALDLALRYSMEWDFVRLCGASTKPKISFEFARQGHYALIEELRDPSLSTAYLLRPSGARKLLKTASHFCIPVDNFIEVRHQNRVRVRSVLPYPVTTMDVASTIGDRHMPNKTLGFRLRRLLFRAGRDLVKYLWVASKCLDHALHGRWPLRRG
jgi:GR25 family glycosyltransferase involved in LPS biosynthesis/exopolysaccharide biosynthesis predicted pyruvyltransferase EpsI